MDVMGVINLYNETDSLDQLTYYRNEASLPFGGNYRLIDFSLSNMVNYGIRDVAIFTSSNYRSLMDHLGTGSDWDLDRKRGGLFILPPSFYTIERKIGDINSFYEHLDYFIRGKSKYIIMSGGNLIYNIDYKPAFDFHKQVSADITILYKRISKNDLFSKWYKVITNQDGRILSIKNNSTYSNKISLEIYIMEKKLLQSLIKNLRNSGLHDFLHDGVIKNIDNLKVYGYQIDEYVAKVDSIKSYYINSMNLLNQGVWEKLFNGKRQIYTKTYNEPPVKYLENSEVINSLIANGCVIKGKVENSILFKGVRVHKEAYIKNSIIMQNCDIGEKSVITNSILDKDIKISSEKSIKGGERIPLILPKKLVI